MRKQINQVAEFHDVFNIYTSHSPSIPSIEISTLRKRLLHEEVQELSDACDDKNIIEIADAITDCIYVLIGTAHSYGLGHVLIDLFDEVHNSNMSKLEDGKPIYATDGKVMKGSSYFIPNIKQVLTKNE